jgi:hypothetical protein
MATDKRSMGAQEEATTVARRFNLGDLFDRAGRLRPLNALSLEIQAEIASFEVVRVTTREAGETVITEELIRIKTRDRRTAEVARRGGGSMSFDQRTGQLRAIRSQPLQSAVVTTVERSMGSGRTASAQAATGEAAR